ncbi:MAG TPA: phosphomannose isomerase type II C-terminal cupin domain [Candidatus Saccharicenans sp.]|jgi:mannose-6-phosphate isomerase-like protein (cupin superfamily)|nr:phosphomannose isomerase type II C-terminal cupin domain [Candidatus Saccharicenans sp.]HOL45961.1 phosphomannose isomerase type II C-terminal cupin domain [Candidatus Saccharicenans sp.]HOM94988.1 phosphomannose isomerase type II C-terminal cupin domain [Candidatus Saccharicenans sp.]HOP60626.1 phosphomannose isomerase type II C-terminal cupin domain [Candidatus Saccharicenans sp.]HPP24642.1 phosphomannose isomerase type II C-terminal cupin domain [Candidatus Saccharicenans sp.]
MSEPITLETIRKLIYEEVRPWGKFRSYPHQLASSLKIITVNPGGLLSLQYHRQRSEYWVVLDVGLEVTLGARCWQPQPGEEIFIPAETPHRLKGAGSQPARVLELWLGSSDENDIVRLEDIYGRG